MNSDGESSSTKPVRKSTVQLGAKRKFGEMASKDLTDTIEEGIKILSSSLSDIARALTVANENFSKSNVRVYSATEIYAELEKHDLSDDEVLDALEFLKSNNEKAGAFICCPDELKGKWLQRNGFKA